MSVRATFDPAGAAYLDGRPLKGEAFVDRAVLGV